MILSLLPEGKRSRRRRQEEQERYEKSAQGRDNGRTYCTYLTRFVSCWLRCSMYSEDYSCVSSGISKSSM